MNRSFIETHTSGFESFKSFLQPFTLEHTSRESGLPPEKIQRLAHTIAQGKRVSFWWTMGVNQGHEATRTAQALINLALMTGNIGRPGTGANSITGQCNAMGSRLFSNITSLIGGRDFTNTHHREKVASLLGIPENSIPRQPNWAYDEIVEGIRQGKIRALWVIATNGSHSWIYQKDFNDCLQKLDFLVVQDMYPTTETAQRAHLYLPAAGWGEKEGTMINSERRIGVARKVRRAPGLALSDFSIFKLIAHYWGCADLFTKWRSPEDVFQILKELSHGTPCDITGIQNYAMLDSCGGVQWPWPATASHNASPPSTERRLFEDGQFFTPDKRARFLYATPRPVAEPIDRDFPFVLMTRRGSSAQWHTGSRTNKSDVLRALAPSNCYVEINPSDALALTITPGSSVTVTSRRGTLEATAMITPTVQPGQIFIPMHYVEVNQLTRPSFDPESRQPSYKHCAVRVSSSRLSPSKSTRDPSSTEGPHSSSASSKRNKTFHEAFLARF